MERGNEDDTNFTPLVNIKVSVLRRIWKPKENRSRLSLETNIEHHVWQKHGGFPEPDDIRTTIFFHRIERSTTRIIQYRLVGPGITHARLQRSLRQFDPPCSAGVVLHRGFRGIVGNIGQ